MLRLIVLTSVSVIALTAAASAADMYVPGPAGPGGYKDGPVYGYSWTGFYAGIQGGGVWGTEHVNYNNGNSDHTKFDGGVLGGQVGAQYQFSNNLVAGVEVSGISADAHGSALCFNPAFSCHSSLRDEFQVVGRLGYAWGNALPYVKGGYANVDLSSTATPIAAGFNEHHSHDGWVAGGGIDYAVLPHIIVGLDWSHIETDQVQYSPAGPSGTARKVDADMDILTARLSYKFGWGYAPLK